MHVPSRGIDILKFYDECADHGGRFELPIIDERQQSGVKGDRKGHGGGILRHDRRSR